MGLAPSALDEPKRPDHNSSSAQDNNDHTSAQKNSLPVKCAVPNASNAGAETGINPHQAHKNPSQHGSAPRKGSSKNIKTAQGHNTKTAFPGNIGPPSPSNASHLSPLQDTQHANSSLCVICKTSDDTERLIGTVHLPADIDLATFTFADLRVSIMQQLGSQIQAARWFFLKATGKGKIQYFHESKTNVVGTLSGSTVFIRELIPMLEAKSGGVIPKGQSKGLKTIRNATTPTIRMRGNRKPCVADNVNVDPATLSSVAPDSARVDIIASAEIPATTQGDHTDHMQNNAVPASADYTTREVAEMVHPNITPSIVPMWIFNTDYDRYLPILSDSTLSMQNKLIHPETGQLLVDVNATQQQPQIRIGANSLQHQHSDKHSVGDHLAIHHLASQTLVLAKSQEINMLNVSQSLGLSSKFNDFVATTNFFNNFNAANNSKMTTYKRENIINIITTALNCVNNNNSAEYADQNVESSKQLSEFMSSLTLPNFITPTLACSNALSACSYQADANEYTLPCNIIKSPLTLQHTLVRDKLMIFHDISTSILSAYKTAFIPMYNPIDYLSLKYCTINHIYDVTNLLYFYISSLCSQLAPIYHHDLEASTRVLHQMQSVMTRAVKLRDLALYRLLFHRRNVGLSRAEAPLSTISTVYSRQNSDNADFSSYDHSDGSGAGLIVRAIAQFCLDVDCIASSISHDYYAVALAKHTAAKSHVKEQLLRSYIDKKMDLGTANKVTDKSKKGKTNKDITRNASSPTQAVTYASKIESSLNDFCTVISSLEFAMSRAINAPREAISLIHSAFFTFDIAYKTKNLRPDHRPPSELHHRQEHNYTVEIKLLPILAQLPQIMGTQKEHALLKSSTGSGKTVLAPIILCIATYCQAYDAHIIPEAIINGSYAYDANDAVFPAQSTYHNDVNPFMKPLQCPFVVMTVPSQAIVTEKYDYFVDKYHINSDLRVIKSKDVAWNCSYFNAVHLYTPVLILSTPQLLVPRLHQPQRALSDAQTKIPGTFLVDPQSKATISALTSSQQLSLGRMRIILDEVHERTAWLDVLLSIICQRHKTNDIVTPLALVVMSATPDMDVMTCLGSEQTGEIILEHKNIYHVTVSMHEVNMEREVAPLAVDYTVQMINNMCKPAQEKTLEESVLYPTGHSLVFMHGLRECDSVRNNICSELHKQKFKEPTNSFYPINYIILNVLPADDTTKYETYCASIRDNAEQLQAQNESKSNQFETSNERSDADLNPYLCPLQFILPITLTGKVSATMKRVATSNFDDPWLNKNVLKVIVATNAVESSVTIDHLTVLVDGGLHKQNTYDPIKGVSTLKTMPITEDSRTQRRGRVGRVSCGQAVQIKFCPGGVSAQGMDHDVPEILSSDPGQIYLELRRYDIRLEDLNHQLPTPLPQAVLTELEGDMVRYQLIHPISHDLTQKGFKVSHMTNLKPMLACQVIDGLFANQREASAVSDWISAHTSPVPQKADADNVLQLRQTGVPAFHFTPQQLAYGLRLFTIVAMVTLDDKLLYHDGINDITISTLTDHTSELATLTNLLIAFTATQVTHNRSVLGINDTLLKMAINTLRTVLEQSTAEVKSYNFDSSFRYSPIKLGENNIHLVVSLAKAIAANHLGYEFPDPTCLLPLQSSLQSSSQGKLPALKDLFLKSAVYLSDKVRLNEAVSATLLSLDVKWIARRLFQFGQVTITPQKQMLGLYDNIIPVDEAVAASAMPNAPKKKTIMKDIFDYSRFYNTNYNNNKVYYPSYCLMINLNINASFQKPMTILSLHHSVSPDAIRNFIENRYNHESEDSLHVISDDTTDIVGDNMVVDQTRVICLENKAIHGIRSISLPASVVSPVRATFELLLDTMLGDLDQYCGKLVIRAPTPKAFFSFDPLSKSTTYTPPARTNAGNQTTSNNDDDGLDDVANNDQILTRMLQTSVTYVFPLPALHDDVLTTIINQVYTMLPYFANDMIIQIQKDIALHVQHNKNASYSENGKGIAYADNQPLKYRQKSIIVSNGKLQQGLARHAQNGVVTSDNTSIYPPHIYPLTSSTLLQYYAFLQAAQSNAALYNAEKNMLIRPVLIAPMNQLIQPHEQEAFEEAHSQTAIYDESLHFSINDYHTPTIAGLQRKKNESLLDQKSMSFGFVVDHDDSQTLMNVYPAASFLGKTMQWFSPEEVEKANSHQQWLDYFSNMNLDPFIVKFESASVAFYSAGNSLQCGFGNRLDLANKGLYTSVENLGAVLNWVKRSVVTSDYHYFRSSPDSHSQNENVASHFFIEPSPSLHIQNKVKMACLEAIPVSSATQVFADNSKWTLSHISAKSQTDTPCFKTLFVRRSKGNRAPFPELDLSLQAMKKDNQKHMPVYAALKSPEVLPDAISITFKNPYIVDNANKKLPPMSADAFKQSQNMFFTHIKSISKELGALCPFCEMQGANATLTLVSLTYIPLLSLMFKTRLKTDEMMLGSNKVTVANSRSIQLPPPRIDLQLSPGLINSRDEMMDIILQTNIYKALLSHIALYMAPSIPVSSHLLTTQEAALVQKRNKTYTPGAPINVWEQKQLMVMTPIYISLANIPIYLRPSTTDESDTFMHHLFNVTMEMASESKLLANNELYAPVTTNDNEKQDDTVLHAKTKIPYVHSMYDLIKLYNTISLSFISTSPICDVNMDSTGHAQDTTAARLDKSGEFSSRHWNSLSSLIQSSVARACGVLPVDVSTPLVLTNVGIIVYVRHPQTRLDDLQQYYRHAHNATIDMIITDYMRNAVDQLPADTNPVIIKLLQTHKQTMAIKLNGNDEPSSTDALKFSSGFSINIGETINAVCFPALGGNAMITSDVNNIIQVDALDECVDIPFPGEARYNIPPTCARVFMCMNNTWISHTEAKRILESNHDIISQYFDIEEELDDSKADLDDDEEVDPDDQSQETLSVARPQIKMTLLAAQSLLPRHFLTSLVPPALDGGRPDYMSVLTRKAARAQAIIASSVQELESADTEISSKNTQESTVKQLKKLNSGETHDEKRRKLIESKQIKEFKDQYKQVYYSPHEDVFYLIQPMSYMVCYNNFIPGDDKTILSKHGIIDWSDESRWTSGELYCSATTARTGQHQLDLDTSLLKYAGIEHDVIQSLFSSYELLVHKLKGLQDVQIVDLQDEVRRQLDRVDIVKLITQNYSSRARVTLAQLRRSKATKRKDNKASSLAGALVQDQVVSLHTVNQHDCLVYPAMMKDSALAVIDLIVKKENMTQINALYQVDMEACHTQAYNNMLTWNAQFNQEYYTSNNINYRQSIFLPAHNIIPFPKADKHVGAFHNAMNGINDDTSTLFGCVMCGGEANTSNHFPLWLMSQAGQSILHDPHFTLPRSSLSALQLLKQHISLDNAQYEAVVQSVNNGTSFAHLTNNRLCIGCYIDTMTDYINPIGNINRKTNDLIIPEKYHVRMNAVLSNQDSYEPMMFFVHKEMDTVQRLPREWTVAHGINHLVGDEVMTIPPPRPDNLGPATRNLSFHVNIAQTLLYFTSSINGVQFSAINNATQGKSKLSTSPSSAKELSFISMVGEHNLRISTHALSLATVIWNYVYAYKSVHSLFVQLFPYRCPTHNAYMTDGSCPVITKSKKCMQKVCSICKEIHVGQCSTALGVVTLILDALAPKTPCCNNFYSFDGCCAITCDPCSVFFCAMCHAKWSDSSSCHTHVLACKFNPGDSYFVNQDELRRVRQSFTRQQVLSQMRESKRQYGAALTPELLSDLWEDRLSKECTPHNITLEDLRNA